MGTSAGTLTIYLNKQQLLDSKTAQTLAGVKHVAKKLEVNYDA